MTGTASKGDIDLIDGPAGRKVMDLAERAHTPDEFEELVHQIEGAQEIAWKPFGGDGADEGGRMAHSAVGAAPDPGHLMAEPLMNSFDALFEVALGLAERDDPEAPLPGSPREAAHRLYDVHEQGLAAWDVRKGDPRRRYEHLAQLTSVRLLDGTRARTPTVVFRDHGIGQHPDDFWGTVLSLQLGNKAGIPYTAGLYGHGAGMLLSFTNGGQIMISRRHPALRREAQADLVGLVLIRKRMPRQTGKPHPLYECLVSKRTSRPFALMPQTMASPDWSGLQRTCIDYDMRGHSYQAVYENLDHVLPHPPLPYELKDDRRAGGKRRYMSGSASRLGAHYADRQHKAKSGIAVPYRRFSDVDLDAVVGEPQGTLGSVRVWRTVVLHEKASAPVREFAPAAGPETWTLNGQSHYARAERHFATKKVGLDALKGHLIVEVELEGLSPDAKADVITTGRQSRALRAIGSQLEDAIDQVLHGDEHLQDWNDKIREQAFRRAASQRIAGLDKALSAFNMAFKQTKKVKVPGKGGDGGKAPVVPPLEPLSPLHEHPTDVFGFRTTTRPQGIVVKRGGTASVVLEADAIDGYFDDPQKLSLRFVPDLGDQLRITTRDSLEGGRMRVWMKAATGASLEAVQLFASCITSSRSFGDDVAVRIIIPPPKRKRPRRKGGREEEREVEAPPPVQVHYRDHPDFPWPEGWTEQTVGEDDKGVARVNGDYEGLAKLRSELPTSKHEDITSVYIAPIAMTIVGLAEADRDAPLGEDGQDVELPPHFRNAALRSAALSSLFAIRYMNRTSGLLGSTDDGDDADDL